MKTKIETIYINHSNGKISVHYTTGTYRKYKTIPKTIINRKNKPFKYRIVSDYAGITVYTDNYWTAYTLGIIDKEGILK